MKKVFFTFIMSVLYIYPAFAFDHKHTLWASFLKKYVVSVNAHESKVDYKKALNDRGELDQYIQQVTTLKKSEYQAMSNEQKQSFLINSYNALTIKLILDHKVPDSIKDIGSLFKATWKIKFFNFLEEESNLDHIEHELARAQFTNCRFHFAFNCASIGCPMLKAEPWLAENLNQQFEQAAKNFVTDPTRNVYSVADDTLELSKIFDWYKEDFKKDNTCGGSVSAFVAKYMNPAEAKKISNQTKIKYLDYNWKLNGR